MMIPVKKNLVTFLLPRMKKFQKLILKIPPKFEDASVGNVLMGLGGSRLRYKVSDSVLGCIVHSDYLRQQVFIN